MALCPTDLCGKVQKCKLSTRTIQSLLIGRMRIDRLVVVTRITHLPVYTSRNNIVVSCWALQFVSDRQLNLINSKTERVYHRTARRDMPCKAGLADLDVLFSVEIPMVSAADFKLPRNVVSRRLIEWLRPIRNCRIRGVRSRSGWTDVKLANSPTKVTQKSWMTTD